MASIRLEFFGVARSRTNVAAVNCDVDRLIDVVTRIKEQFPTLAELCLEDGQLSAGWLLNVNGAVFTRDLNTTLHDGDSVLLIPADAGG